MLSRSSSRPAGTTLRRRIRRLTGLGAVAALALLLRLAALPERGDVRDMDEIGYALGGLVLWEGMAPGYQFAPAGPVTWLGWTRVALASARSLAHASDQPIHLRPFVAVGRALSREHEDLAPLRRVLLAWSVLAGTAGAVAAAVLGGRIAGRPGFAAAGVVAASLPLFVEHAAMTKPYADAWALGLVSASLALSRREVVSGPAAASLMGLSISSRIDMVLLVPVLLLLRCSRGGASRRAHASWLATSAIAFAVASPWFVTGLLGNLRTIVSVRFFSASLVPSPPGAAIRELAGEQGLAVVAGLALLGCLRVARRCLSRRRPMPAACAGCVVLLLASALAGTAYGLRHQGAVIVALVIASAWGLRECARIAGRRAAALVACCALLAPAVLGFRETARLRSESLPSDPAGWIEAHVPQGTPVYLTMSEERPPLPTRECGERLWREVAGADAWRAKVERQLRLHGLAPGALPPALSEAHLVQERSFRRRWAHLAASDATRPRFDLHPWSDASAFDVASSELLARVRETGGVVIHRGGRPIDALEPAAASWLSATGVGCRVYVAAPPSARASPAPSWARGRRR